MWQKNLKLFQLTLVHLDHGARSITFCIPRSAVQHSSPIKQKKIRLKYREIFAESGRTLSSKKNWYNYNLLLCT